MSISENLETDTKLIPTETTEGIPKPNRYWDLGKSTDWKPISKKSQNLPTIMLSKYIIFLS